MTANQINYWAMKEREAHDTRADAETERANKAKEFHNALVLGEDVRHNQATEEAGMINARANQRNASTNAITERMNAITNANKQKEDVRYHDMDIGQRYYSSDLEAYTKQYAADLSAATQMAVTEINKALTEWKTIQDNLSRLDVANLGFAGTAYMADTNKEIAYVQANAAMERVLAENTNKLLTALIGAGTSRYVADVGAAASKDVAQINKESNIEGKGISFVEGILGSVFNLLGTKYSADTNLEGVRYMTDQRYVSDFGKALPEFFNKWFGKGDSSETFYQPNPIDIDPVTDPGGIDVPLVLPEPAVQDYGSYGGFPLLIPAGGGGGGLPAGYDASNGWFEQIK